MTAAPAVAWIPPTPINVQTIVPARTFAGMVAVSVGTVLLSGFFGIFASYHIDSAPAPTMVLFKTGFLSWCLL